MGPGPVWLVVFFVLGASPADAGVTQTPRYLLVRTGTKVILRCAQNMAHDAMYWYRQDPGQGLRLIRFSRVKGSTEEGDIPQGYLVSREEKELFPLTLGSANTNQSSLYFCASSTEENSPLNFGAGTRLTVTDDLQMVKLPKVTLFDPSEEEINELGKATLVCLATGFFPDLVEISWWVDGQETKEGVSTDAQPLNYTETESSIRTYALSSRLRVSAGFWQNPWRRFRCQVHFYGLQDNDTWTDNTRPKPVTQNISAETWGKADCGITAASYQKSVQSATFLYEILLGKALVYAVLVSTLVWRAKAKKHIL